MPTKARGKDVAPTIRGAWIRAVKQLDNEGKPLSTLLKAAIEKDVLASLKAIQGFVPKELLLGESEENPLKALIKVEFVSAKKD